MRAMKALYKLLDNVGLKLCIHGLYFVYMTKSLLS